MFDTRQSTATLYIRIYFTLYIQKNRMISSIANG
jgi:hypothetical protein